MVLKNYRLICIHKFIIIIYLVYLNQIGLILIPIISITHSIQQKYECSNKSSFFFFLQNLLTMELTCNHIHLVYKYLYDYTNFFTRYDDPLLRNRI